MRSNRCGRSRCLFSPRPRARGLLLLLGLLGVGCNSGPGTPVPFGEACVKANEEKLLAIEGIIEPDSNLACEVRQYDKTSGHCAFSLISFEGTSAGRFSLDIDKGDGKNQVSLGGQDGVGLRRYDPDKVVFTDKAGKSFRFRDRIRVVAKIHVDPIINPQFPPSCSLDMKSLELVAAGTPADDKAREVARGSILSPKQDKTCAKGDDIRIAGVKDVVNVTGECGSVHVSGGENQVTIEAAANITVDGIRNIVRWRRGQGGKQPKISKSGIDNKVERLP